MKKIISLITLSILLLSSCQSGIDTPIQKKYSTFVVKNGTLTMTDTVIATVEGGTTSRIGFTMAGRVQSVRVHPGDRVREGQILATLGNRESEIQQAGYAQIVDRIDALSDSTNSIILRTEGLIPSTKKLYQKRLDSIDASILSLKNTLEKAQQNLTNQQSSLMSTFLTLAHEYESLASTLLYEGDKILGITTNFEYTNDGWENYLGIRIGNARSDAENQWGSLYALRGTIRAYSESGATISDIDTAISDLTRAYASARRYATSMDTMLQNSLVGGGLSEEKLNTWVASWTNYTNQVGQSESNLINWKNTTKNLTQKNTNQSSVAEKEITTLELELKNLEISRDTILAEQDTKIREIQANIATIKSRDTELSIQRAQTDMSNALARETSDRDILRAPYDGVILERLIDVGDIVSPGVTTLQISSLDRHLIRTYIDNDLYRYKVGTTLSLSHLSSHQSLTGTITRIQSERDPLHNKNYTEITIQGSSIEIGDRVMLQLSRKKTPLQNGSIIPLESIITRYGTPGVYEIIDGRAHLTLVQVIGSDLRFAEVIGLRGDTTIITTGKEHIIDGEILSIADTVQSSSDE